MFGSLYPVPLTTAQITDSTRQILRGARITPYIAPEMKGHFRLNDCFVGANTRDAVNEGRADYVPVHLHEMARLFRRRVIPLDCALVIVSPPDEHGYCSFGIEVGVTKQAAMAAALASAALDMVSHKIKST